MTSDRYEVLSPTGYGLTISNGNEDTNNSFYGGGINVQEERFCTSRIVSFKTARWALGNAQADTFFGEGGGIFIAGRDGNSNPGTTIVLSDTYIINNHANDALGLFKDGAHTLRTNAVTAKDNTGVP